MYLFRRATRISAGVNIAGSPGLQRFIFGNAWVQKLWCWISSAVPVIKLVMSALTKFMAQLVFNYPLPDEYFLTLHLQAAFVV